MQRALSRNSASNPSATDDDPTHLGPLETILSCLWVLTPLTATVSLLVVLVAILTNQWLHTEEKMNNPTYNGTGEKEYLSKFTISGLWMLCFTNPGDPLYECSKIEYFSKEAYSPDPNDSTMAIPYAVTKSAMFFASAAFLLCSGYCCAVVGQCARHKSLCTFVAGVVFIVTGLSMLFGLIMYVSIFKAEVGSKLRPHSQLQPPTFSYWYGYSFLLYVSGFICTQLSGVSAIFLFIYRAQYDWHQKRAYQHRHGKYSPSSNHFDNTFNHSAYYPCRRHPHAYINSNSAIHLSMYYSNSIRKKQFFFGKKLDDEIAPCNIHRSGLHREALKGSFYDFAPPPPPAISYQFDEHSGVDTISRHFPRDMTTTTVSTTADVNCDQLIPEEFDDYSPSGVQHEDDFVTFNLDRPLPLYNAQSIMSICSVSENCGGMDKKNFDCDSLRRTTPV